MSTQFQFNAAEVPPESGFDILPKGWYNAHVTESEITPTKAGDGTVLKMTYEILDGFAKGRKIFANYNIRNPNETAEKIGKGQLSAAMHAMNYTLIQQHTGELHNKPLKIKLKVMPAKGEYDEKNEITNYKKFDEQVELATAPTAIVAPSSAPAFGGPPSTFSAPPVNAPQAFTPAPVTGAPAPAPAPTPAPVPVEHKMTPAAEGIPYEDYIKAGWTDELLIQHGKMEKPFVPPTAAQPWDKGAAGTTPAPPGAPAAPAAAAGPAPGWNGAAPISAPPATAAAPEVPSTPAVITGAKAPWEK